MDGWMNGWMDGWLLRRGLARRFVFYIPCFELRSLNCLNGMERILDHYLEFLVTHPFERASDMAGPRLGLAWHDLTRVKRVLSA